MLEILTNERQKVELEKKRKRECWENFVGGLEKEKYEESAKRKRVV